MTTDKTLAIGATGDCVQRLRGMLRAILPAIELPSGPLAQQDIDALTQAVSGPLPTACGPSVITAAGVEGALITPDVWDKLRAVAAGATGLTDPATLPTSVPAAAAQVPQPMQAG